MTADTPSSELVPVAWRTVDADGRTNSLRAELGCDVPGFPSVKDGWEPLYGPDTIAALLRERDAQAKVIEALVAVDKRYDYDERTDCYFVCGPEFRAVLAFVPRAGLNTQGSGNG